MISLIVWLYEIKFGCEYKYRCGSHVNIDFNVNVERERLYLLHKDILKPNTN